MEALQVLSTRHSVRFNEMDLDNLLLSFGLWLKYITSMTLYARVFDREVYRIERRTFEQLSKMVTQLHHLEAHFTIFKIDGHAYLFTDGILNHFRALAQLQLDRATVFIWETDETMSKATVRDLERRARALLLAKGPQPQVPVPDHARFKEGHSAAIKEVVHS